MHSDDFIGAPFDFLGLGQISARCKTPSRIIAPTLGPVDDGTASLNDGLAVEDDWKRGSPRATALCQH